MPASREEVERLVEGLHKAGSVTDQRIRLRQLAETQHPAAVPHVAHELTNPHELVRHTAAENLVKMGKAALPEIKKAVESEDGLVRASIAWALGQKGDIDKEAVPLLLGLVNDKKWEVRQNAIGALGKHGDPRALPLIIKRIRKTENREVRTVAIRALGSFPHPRIIRLLNRPLRDKEKDIRWGACTALARIGGPAVLPGLTRALEDKENKVWTEAATSVYTVNKNLKGNEPKDEKARALFLVHPHLRENDEPDVMRNAYLAALNGEVDKGNARLFVKQLRAVKGKLK